MGVQESHVDVLLMSPAEPGHRRLAVIVLLLSLVAFTALVPFARVPLKPFPAFIAAYQSALVINDLITATLLYSQFAVGRVSALLVLASGYLFTALMAVIHALTFPGLFAPTGLLGAGLQTTAWLYMIWHGGFPVAVIGYALVQRRQPAPTRVRPAVAVLLAVACVLAAVAALTALATVGQGVLPAIINDEHYTARMIVVVSGLWLLGAAASIILLWGRRPYTVLDMWVIVVMCVWLLHIALSAVLNSGHFDVGFYAGRMYGLLAACVLLIVLLSETVQLYARLAASLAAQHQASERRLLEVSDELIHVSRLTELGQMVAALAHELMQPLSAAQMFIDSSRRLVQGGEWPKAHDVLDKAGEAVGSTIKIVGRLRDLIKKAQNGRTVEDLRTVIDDAASIAAAAAGDTRVRIDVTPKRGGFAAHIDRVQIQQVLLNLLRNAIEAMAGSPRPRIVVEIAPAQGDMIEVGVVDSGPGLPEDVKARLFQPFVTTKGDGIGVALSICRLIIEAHGGEIWADSPPGGGAAFRFTVPSAKADVSDAAAVS